MKHLAEDNEAAAVGPVGKVEAARSDKTDGRMVHIMYSIERTVLYAAVTLYVIAFIEQREPKRPARARHLGLLRRYDSWASFTSPHAEVHW